MFAKNSNRQKASPIKGNCVHKLINADFIKLQSYRKCCKTCKKKVCFCKDECDTNYKTPSTRNNSNCKSRNELRSMTLTSNLSIQSPKNMIMNDQFTQTNESSLDLLNQQNESKDPKIDMAEYERIMSQIFDNTISEMNTKYNEDMQEASKHIQNLRDLNEKLEHECNIPLSLIPYISPRNDQYHLILQLKANYDSAEAQIKDLTKERDALKTEIDNCVIQPPTQKCIDGLRRAADSEQTNTQIIKDCKDKIFTFLINERNKGNDEVRVGFYKSIINLLKLAKDTEEDSSFDLKLLIDYYSSEGQKYYGPDYVFHESEKEQKTDDNFDITLNKQINKPTHKHNKSDTISDFSKNLTNNVDSDDKSVNNKIKSLTDGASNVSKKKKIGKKSQIRENKIKELTDQIEKLKADLKNNQHLLKESAQNQISFKCNPPSNSRFSMIYTEKPILQKFHTFSQSTPQEIKDRECEDLLQFVATLTQLTESIILD